MRHTRWFLPAVLAAALPSLAQSPATPAPPPGAPASGVPTPGAAPEGAPKPPEPRSPEVVKGLLAEVYARNTFAYLPGPYHFVATFDTFTPDGKPAGSGTIEKFFAGPGHMKVITRFRDHTMTAWYGGGGGGASSAGGGMVAGPEPRALFTDDGFDGTIMTFLASDFLLEPLPPPLNIARRDMQTSIMPSADGRTLDCGMYQLFVNPTGLPPAPKETFCVERGTRNLVLRQTQYFSVEYGQFEPFQGRSIARSIVATRDGVARLRVHVNQIDQQALDDAALTPPADASPVSPAPEWYQLNSKEGTPLHKNMPVWPSDVRAKATGPVSLRLLIGPTGAVKDVEVVYAPSPEFAQAAMDAVKQWTYAPIVRRGRPVEAMTTIVLSFGG